MKKQPLLLLHGALGTGKQFDQLIPLMKNEFEIYVPDLEGHGQSESKSGPFKIENFMDEVLDVLNQQQINQIDIFGYSMGGYIALLLAKNYPGKVDKIAILGTVLQ